jgi:hypothetical protein
MIRSELIAVLIAVSDGHPMVLTLDGGTRLPSGPLESRQRSLQTGMRRWVERQTGHALGHIEQLYTFADAPHDDHHDPERTIMISYLALTRIGAQSEGWRDWYRYFPWEDQTAPEGRGFVERIGARLHDWARHGPAMLRDQRLTRIAITFGLDGATWDDELALQRYELLWEAGLVPEAVRDTPVPQDTSFVPGVPMTGDHRRILATGMARLRAKIRYRPVIFELMPETFTLLALQKTVEAVAGRPMHKQNFRRLIAQQNLVEETAAFATDTPGRPARLYRFRRDVIGARRVAGSTLPLARP